MYFANYATLVGICIPMTNKMDVAACQRDSGVTNQDGCAMVALYLINSEGLEYSGTI